MHTCSGVECLSLCFLSHGAVCAYAAFVLHVSAVSVSFFVSFVAYVPKSAVPVPMQHVCLHYVETLAAALQTVALFLSVL